MQSTSTSTRNPAIVLAPMEGVTDAPMRAMLTSLGGYSWCVTEFLRVSSNVLPARVVLKHVPELKTGAVTASDTPVHVQLLGGDPEKLAEQAFVAVQSGARAIDLNFGCPAPTVNRHDGGATILKYPERLEGIVRAVRSRVPADVSVSAKLRLGWDDPSAIIENVQRAERGGASWITIHARTKMQGYRPPGHWDWIAKARENLNIPVIANGEMWTVDEFKRCRDVTGSSHFMIGRGALANPLLGAEIAYELGITRTKPDPATLASPEWWLPHLIRYAALVEPHSPSGALALARIKQWLKFTKMKTELPWFDGFKTHTNLTEALSWLGTYPKYTSTPTFQITT